MPLFRHAGTRHNDRVKAVALTAMVLDHINTMFLLPPRPELYALVRMAIPLSFASYGLQGLILALSLCTLNGAGHLTDKPADTLIYAVLPTALFPLLALSLASRYPSTKSPRFLPRWFFYLSYGGHLLLLGLICLALK
jgi:hypothetical protein